ncbi:hypothetical protein FE840_001445 [Peteryoungia desertarenae]|uniref:Uncharacterized protein n=1 Tax=Peteryoungia desertarenae TaxID=1813451 RepID=A0ABX6QID5_9HYPH|nr:hypothetical protein [Peteryoungia desertarenae]QLF68324.1 hypothetical protein FE840_001445 [Peteryoungia desertarenae]
MTEIVNLTDIHIESKVEAAVRKHVAQGLIPSRATKEDLSLIAEGIWKEMNPVLQEQAALAFIQNVAKCFLGEKIAKVLWDHGLGWDVNAETIHKAAERLRIERESASDCLQSYREALFQATTEDLSNFASFGRFAPLLLGMPEGTTLQEAATVKLARRDKLAMAFFAGRPV